LDHDDEADVKKIKPRAVWKIKTEKLLENYYWVGALSLVTFYALFADDLKLLLLPKEADLTMDVITLLFMSLYFLELIMGVVAVPKYFLSFYFWVDLISTLSMLADVTFILNPMTEALGGETSGADIAKTGRASRVIKIIRIIRLIRLLRVLKLYKQVKSSQKIKNQKIQEQREQKRLARKKGSSLGTLTTVNFEKTGTGDDGNDSVDSFDKAVAQCDRDFAENLLDDDLKLEKLA